MMNNVTVFFLCLAYIFISRSLMGSIIGPVSTTVLSSMVVAGVMLLFPINP